MTRIVARGARLLWLVCFSSAYLSSQQISLPAMVLDQSGHSVHNLQKSDFVVNCGKSVSFDSVEEVAPVSLNGFGDPIPIFILYDPVSVEPKDQKRVATLLLGILQQAASQHLPVTIMKNLGTGMAVVHDLSIPPAVLAAALSRLKGSSSPETDAAVSQGGPEFAAKVEEEIKRLQELNQLALSKRWGLDEAVSLRGLEVMSDMLQKSRRRKLLIWITGYFDTTVGPHELTVASGGYVPPGHVAFPSEVYSNYRTAMQSLNNSRISVYPLWVGDGGHWAVATDFRTSEKGLEIKNALEGVASQTGGRSLGNLDDVDLAASAEELRKHFESYYVLSLSVQPEKRQTWSPITVGVTRSDSKVAAPSGFILGK
jgi:VWFA-related protein